MAKIKTKVTKSSVVAFIAAVPDPVRRAEATEILKLMRDVTKENGELWSNGMIGFGRYHYKSERSSQEGDWPLTAFSPRKANITIYIMSGISTEQKYTALLKKMGPHKVSGGSCIYISNLSKIDLAILKKIVASSFATMKKKYKVK